MDIFILLGTMIVCFLIGMPIAYSLAMAAIAGALSVGITYLPIPVGGVCLLLFIIERMFLGAPADPLGAHREDVSFD